MAVLDLDHLKKIVGNDPAFLKQVLQIFIRNTPIDMQALSKSVENKNHEEVGFYAHKLKSAAGAIGYSQAYEDFKKLEILAGDLHNMEEIASMVNEMNQECMPCMVDIQDIMESL
jgi:HPt (histidine-containing phosphotransfer) domain-containing protein